MVMSALAFYYVATSYIASKLKIFWLAIIEQLDARTLLDIVLETNKLPSKWQKLKITINFMEIQN